METSIGGARPDFRFAGGLVGAGDRQFERKCCPFARTFAVDAQRTVHLSGRQSSAVEPEPVPIFFGGETMAENACKIFRSDANSIVSNGDGDVSFSGLSGGGFDALFGWILFVQSVFGVAQ